MEKDACKCINEIQKGKDHIWYRLTEVENTTYDKQDVMMKNHAKEWDLWCKYLKVTDNTHFTCQNKPDNLEHHRITLTRLESK